VDKTERASERSEGKPPTGRRGPKRSLILAGGGVKVAFQAGVLQVWLDEAGLTFDHADGASGGVFNLAMYAQGMSGREIADNWRFADPLRGVQPNWGALLRGPYGQSLFKLSRFRRNTFADWGLDWDRIRAADRLCTFNAYNFSRNELVVRTAEQVDEDFVTAAVSLPMWFPPMNIDGDTYIDAVYITDANLEEAIRRGADELWVIWTVSRQRAWRDGFVATYFQVIETAANGHFKRVLDRIEANNQAVARGEAGEFGRQVKVKVLYGEVPLNYLINFSRDRTAEAVNLGVVAARRWCTQAGVPLAAPPAEPPDPLTALRFTEEMKGFMAFGEEDYRRGHDRGRAEGNRFMFHLTMDIRGINRFILNPEHDAPARGWVECEALGGRLPVVDGRFNLLIQQERPGHQHMQYRLFFRDSAGHPLTLSGFKDVQDHGGLDLWADTTTLYVRILKGHVGAEDEDKADRVAAGILRIHPLDFARQLTTFRAEAPTLRDRVEVIRRFAQLFVGKLWDVYGQGVLPWSPV
jgi:predicted patatin/cPLA2 family phospholipase